MSNPSEPVSDITPNAQSSNPAESIKLPPETVALVLSGGGAKGDFEVGVVRCLYNNGIVPQILCGTSVGSVNALKLAEGEHSPIPGTPPSGFVRGLRGLERIWLGLQDDRDMWALEPGVDDLFTTLEKALPAEAAALAGDAADLGSATIGGFVGSLLGIPGFASFLPQASVLTTIKSQLAAIMSQLTATVNEAENLLGFINYDPLEKLMRKPGSFFAPAQQSSGLRLRLAMVALEDGALRYVTEKNVMIERDGQVTPVLPEPSAAQMQALQAKIAALKSEIAALQPQSSPSLGPIQKPSPGLSAKVNQLGSLENELAKLKAQVRPDLVRAAIASSSLPLICRPTTMQDGRTYVDGGIRTLAPIEAAIDAGATKVFAIAAGSRKFDVETMDQISASAPLPLMGIALRVGIGILPDEVGRRDLFPPAPWPVPVIVIQPDPFLDDLHDGLTLEPGLIRIQMAYGFMRAWDTLRAYEKSPKNYQAVAQESSKKGRTFDIVQLRKRIWDKEFPANGKELVPAPAGFPPRPYAIKNLPAPIQGAHDEVRMMKLHLAKLVQERIEFYTDPSQGLKGVESLPDDFETWSTDWEKHSWTPAGPL